MGMSETMSDQPANDEQTMSDQEFDLECGRRMGTLQWFAGNEMQRTLLLNLAKGDWGDAGIGDLFAELEGEVEEARDAFKHLAALNTAVPREARMWIMGKFDVISELADIAVYALICADWLRRQPDPEAASILGPA